MCQNDTRCKNFQKFFAIGRNNEDYFILPWNLGKK